MWLRLCVYAASMLVAYVAYVVITTQLRWASWLRHVPGPQRSSWMMGNLPAFQRRHFIPVCREWSQMYGGAVRHWGMFGEPRLLLTDPVGIDYVLRKRVYAFPKPRLLRRTIGGIMGEGLLVAEGESHKRQKRAIQPGFSMRAIRHLMPVFQRHARLLHDHYESLVSKEIIMMDVYALFGAAAMDVVGEGALGVDLGILASVRSNPNGDAYASHPLTASLNRALKMASKPSHATLLLDMATVYFPILEWIPLGISSPAFRKEARVIVDVASEIVKNAKARVAEESSMNECPDILASLLRANANTSRKESEKSCLLDRTALTDTELTAQVSTFIFAGHETTATQLSWLFLLLAQHPEQQSALRAAIRSKRIEVGLPLKRTRNDAGSEELSQDDLEAIPYLDWCIRESLRLHTAIHSTSRVATESEWIPLSTGRHVQVHKGMIILIPLTSISTSPDLWGAEPECFRPERWSESMCGPKKFPAVYSWSFLMGPRACIGSAFAMAEMKAFTAMLINHYEFEWDGRQIVPKPWLLSRPYDVARKKDTCVLRVRHAP